MDTLIAHCHLDGRACTRRDGAVLILLKDDAVFCGHCDECMAPAGGHVSFMNITCEGDDVVWFQRELKTVVHRCGSDLVAEAAESMLVDLTADAALV